MNSKLEVRSFFVLYSNGDTFYFTVTPNLEIYCTKFINMYESNSRQMMPGAHSLEFIGDSFVLKNIDGEKIYSLETYRMLMNNFIPIQEELPTIERLYIDEDVRIALLSAGKIKYDEKASKIPGLLYEPHQELSRTLKKHQI